MDASSHSNMEASPFVATTKRSIVPLKKQKEEGIKTDHKTIDLALEALKHFFVNIPDTYIMNFVQYKDLLTKAKGNPDIVELTQYYKYDFTSQIKMLRETYSSFSNRSIKNWISQIIKKLELHGNWIKEKDCGGSISPQDPDSDTDFSILSEDDVSINLSAHSEVAFPWIQFDVISALVRDWSCYTGIAEEFAVAESNYENV